MSEIKEYFEQCEDCYKSVNMMEIIVKETPDGNCIYCPDCVKHHKYLEEQTKILCKKWGIDPVKYGKEVEQQEKRLLRESKRLEKNKGEK